MKTTVYAIIALAILSLTGQPLSAQHCKQHKKPSKSLYKAPYFAKYEIEEPSKLDYATKAVLFFDAFVFTGVYSLTINEEKPYFYLNLSGPASYPYEVTLEDSVHFYYEDGSSYGLKPSCNQLGFQANTMAFYHIDDQFLKKTKELSLDSIIMTFTPRPKTSKKEEELVTSFTFRHFSQKRTAGFKALAGCFSLKLEEYDK